MSWTAERCAQGHRSLSGQISSLSSALIDARQRAGIITILLATFEDIPDVTLPDEIKQLVGHIIETKAGHFEPSKFEDHYEAALISLLRAKQKGKEVKEPEEVPRPAKVINLMDALRQSINAATAESAKRKPAKKKHAR